MLTICFFCMLNEYMSLDKVADLLAYLARCRMLIALHRFCLCMCYHSPLELQSCSSLYLTSGPCELELQV